MLCPFQPRHQATSATAMNTVASGIRRVTANLSYPTCLGDAGATLTFDKLETDVNLRRYYMAWMQCQGRMKLSS